MNPFSTQPPALPSLPAACADCLQTTIPSIPGTNPEQLAMQQFRSAEGKLRFDFGTTSMILNPQAQIQIFLNHLTQEARIIPNVPAMPGMPAIPGMSAMPGMHAIPMGGAIPGLNVPGQPQIQQLGTRVIQGLEAEGMRYVFPIGGAISSWEVWTSTKLKMPVMTTTIGSFGQKTCTCKCSPVSPPPSTFDIPPGYTVIQPPNLSGPSLQQPNIPQIPQPPIPRGT